MLSAVRTYAEDGAVLFETQNPSCRTAIIVNKRWKVLRVRQSNIVENNNRCTATKEDLYAVLAGAFDRMVESGDQTPYESVFLGRIMYFDWLGRHLVERALSDKRWSTKAGKPHGDAAALALNAYVGDVLGEAAVLGDLNPAAAIANYVFAGVSCEKTLVSSSSTKPFEPKWTPKDKRVPYDAMCWLKLEKLNHNNGPQK